MNHPLVLCLLLTAALLSGANAAEDFPFAKGTFEANKLKQWSFADVRKHRDDAIGNLAGKDTVAKKDNAANTAFLAYVSKVVEQKTFSTDLDLTGDKGLIFFAIQVDDKATLTVNETLTGKEPAGHTAINETYSVDGTALWKKDRSYKEFATPILGGRKYKLQLDYRNTHNLTEKHKPLIDHDGVNIFLVLLPATIESVSFSGDKYWQLREDKDAKKVLAAPHWVDKNGDTDAKDAGEHNYSVAFTSASKPKVESDFKITGLPNGSVVKIKGSGSDGLKLPEKTATNKGAIYTYPVTESVDAWRKAGEVGFYSRSDPANAFAIEWQVQIDGGPWLNIGKTLHQVYLTLADPTTTYRHESIFFHACRKAKGMKDRTTIVDAIYTEFTDQVVSRIDPVTGQNTVDTAGMKYWGALPAGVPFRDCKNMDGFLKYGTTTCGTWAEYFHGMISVHGIANDIALVNGVMPPKPDYPAMLADYKATYLTDVKAVYVAAGVQLYAAPEFNPASDRIIFVASNNEDFNTAIFSVRDAPNSADHKHIKLPANQLDPLLGSSSPAQGMPNARNWFGNHAIVKYGRDYYDPSYGTSKQGSKIAWEKPALEYHGLYVLGDADATAIVDRPSFYVDRQDDEAKQDANINP